MQLNSVVPKCQRSLVVLQGFEGELRHWDVTFWAERLREAKFAITDEQLRPYFALPNVLDGLFKVRAWPTEPSLSSLSTLPAHSQYSMPLR